MYGSNDIRYNDKKLPKLIERIETLLNLTQLKETITLFFTSIIPSPRTDRTSKHHYRKFNNLVETMVRHHPRAVFINITKHMFRNFGATFLNSMYKRDGIHLNKEGAMQVAQYIFESMNEHASQSKQPPAQHTPTTIP